MASEELIAHEGLWSLRWDGVGWGKEVTRRVCSSDMCILVGFNFLYVLKLRIVHLLMYCVAIVLCMEANILGLHDFGLPPWEKIPLFYLLKLISTDSAQLTQFPIQSGNYLNYNSSSRTNKIYQHTSGLTSTPPNTEVQ